MIYAIFTCVFNTYSIYNCYIFIFWEIIVRNFIPRNTSFVIFIFVAFMSYRCSYLFTSLLQTHSTKATLRRPFPANATNFNFSSRIMATVRSLSMNLLTKRRQSPLKTAIFLFLNVIQTPLNYQVIDILSSWWNFYIFFISKSYWNWRKIIFEFSKFSKVKW